MPDTVSAYGISKQPVFIGGLMKSGTSLLRTLLGQHPDLFASYETHWYEDEIRYHWANMASRRILYLKKFYELDDGIYNSLCKIKEETPEREFIDIVLEYCRNRANKLRWIEKTPGNIRHWKLALGIWPDAKLIHVKRNYKDCFASWKDKRGDDLDDFLRSARQAYSDIDELLGTYSENYIEVEYDALITDTVNVMNEILRFIGVEWDDRCASIDLEGARVERKKVKQVTGKDSKTNISLEKPIFSDSIGQWKAILSNEEALKIDHELARWSRRLGMG